jgi:predicted ester cyclase
MEFASASKEASDSAVAESFDLDDMVTSSPPTSLQEDEELFAWLNSFDEASGSMTQEYPESRSAAGSPVPPPPVPVAVKVEAAAASSGWGGIFAGITSWGDAAGPKPEATTPAPWDPEGKLLGACLSQGLTPVGASDTKSPRKKAKTAKGSKVTKEDEKTTDSASDIKETPATSGDDDEDAKIKKMKYNREAARRSRKRKRDQLETLQQKLDELEQENQILGLEVKNASERSSEEQQLLMQSRMQTVRQVIDAFNKGIDESIRVSTELCAVDDIVFCSPDMGQLKGMSNTLDYLKMLMEALPDVIIQVNSLKVENSSNKILMDWEIRGTHEGVLIGIPPTGLIINTQGTCEWSFIGNRVSRVSLVWKHGLAPLIKTIIGGLAGMASRAVQSVAGSVVGVFRSTHAVEDSKKQKVMAEPTSPNSVSNKDIFDQAAY